MKNIKDDKLLEENINEQFVKDMADNILQFNLIFTFGVFYLLLKRLGVI